MKYSRCKGRISEYIVLKISCTMLHKEFNTSVTYTSDSNSRFVSLNQQNTVVVQETKSYM